MPTHNFQAPSLVIQLMILLSLDCVKVLHSHQHKLKLLIIFCIIHKGEFDIGGNPSHQFELACLIK